MEIGQIDHVYYWVSDMGAAVTFYREVVGLSLLSKGEEWSEFDAPPIKLALHASKEPAPGSGTVVFRVADLDGARWDLENRGAKFDEFVGEVAGLARFATFRDLDGNPIQIIEYQG